MKNRENGSDGLNGLNNFGPPSLRQTGLADQTVKPKNKIDLRSYTQLK